jgi:phage host-nuclease inhibitor protein Gam
MGLNALQTQELQELQQVERERFKITDIGGVNWALRKLAALKAREAEVNQLADAEIERINAWREKELESVKRDVEYFESLLTEYHAEQLKQDPKAKTITTPYGTLKARKLPPMVEYDADLVLSWAKGAGRTEFIRVREELAKDAVREAVLSDGELVPGVTVIDQGVKYSVEVDV